MSDAVRRHYESYPYPGYPLLASVRRCDTFALNLTALWTRFNGELPPEHARKILIAGCGSFAPYPFALSNPDIPITALDLSRSNLKRARMHCLLHGIRNVVFCQGNLLDRETAEGPYGFIDSYGVIHHMPDPLQGLKTLKSRLSEGGIIRIMVYSRYARKDEESIRRAFSMIGVQDAAAAKQLIKRAKPDSRLKRFAEASYEAASVSGLADALLHPCVKTFRIDELMELIAQAGLRPLLFAHNDALENVEAEVDRIRCMESGRRSPGNFVVYLGRNTQVPCEDKTDAYLQINPCLRKITSRMRIGSKKIAPHLGHAAPLLGHKERSFLRRFIKPVQRGSLSTEDQAKADSYTRELFLSAFS